MSAASFPADEGASKRTFPSVAVSPAGTMTSADGHAGRSEPAPNSHLIDLTGITYTYEGEAQPVLRNVGLTVEEGEFILILGPSGCGKSTLLHLLNGSVPHLLGGTLAGSAVICGKLVAETAVSSFATDVGMVFQDPDAQIINTRVRDEVCFGLENLCRPADEILIRQQEALEFVGLGDFGDRSIFELSGGQKQRVSIAAVLAARPRLLVLDEPTANLDPAGMAEVFSVLARLNREHGTTIVMVEHRVDELADKVSRVVMMDRGTIVFDGSPRAAFSSRRVIHSEEADVVPTASWFPQVSEFAMELTQAAGMALESDHVPLSVAEAVALCDTVTPMTTPALPEPAPLPASTPLLTIRSMNFGYDRKKPILRNVNLSLGSNRIVALLGRNGSGKTTLARMLVGINDAPAGAIELNGRDIAKLGAREIAAEVGYVFQNPDHQFVTDRVDEEVAYGLRVRDFADAEVERRVAEVLSIVDLARYRNRSPFSLSLGERRRLSVATMMVLEPKLLVLDEPTIGQDHERAQQLMGLMSRLRERYGTTILMITHDVRLVAEWADRALVLRAGEIAFDGAPVELFGKADLLESSGLLAPPIYEVSRQLAARHPERGISPVLSPAELVSSIAVSSQARFA